MARASNTTAIHCTGYPGACRKWATRAATLNGGAGKPLIRTLCAQCCDRAVAAHDLISSWGAITAPDFAASFWKAYPAQKPKYD